MFMAHALSPKSNALAGGHEHQRNNGRPHGVCAQIAYCGASVLEVAPALSDRRAEVDIHLNNLLGGKIGVADVCVFDKSTVCTGSIDATENYWGCVAGPGGPGCTTASGSDITFTPWLLKVVTQ
jgi:hypothetical protein